MNLIKSVRAYEDLSVIIKRNISLAVMFHR